MLHLLMVKFLNWNLVKRYTRVSFGREFHAIPRKRQAVQVN